MLPHIKDATGLVPESARKGSPWSIRRGDLTDLALPEEGTEGHLTLLIAEFLANRLRSDPEVTVGFAELCAHTAGLIAAHRSRWRKDVGAPGADRVLTGLTWIDWRDFSWHAASDRRFSRFRPSPAMRWRRY